METIYYKVHIEWAPYPWHDEIDDKYVVFYRRKKKKFIMIPELRMESNTSIEEKKLYLMKKLNVKQVNVIKIK
jgi:hypothetical protein